MLGISPHNTVEFSYESLEEAFPACDPGIEPLGSRVLLQVRQPKKMTKGGIHLIDDVRDTETYNTQVGKVLACGPLAFRNRNTGQEWPEGAWVKPGDYVRMPKYGGDRWSVKLFNEDGSARLDRDGKQEEAIVVLFDDLNLSAKITGDPTLIKAFV